MSVALHEAIGPRTTRLSVLVSAPEADEIAARAKAANLSVSAYLRAQALASGGAGTEDDALAIFDQVIDTLATRLDAANSSLEAALARLTP
jgi:hypothetical protein